MTVGAYSAYAAVEYMGLPLPIAFVAGLAAGAVIGAVMHLFVVRHMLKTDGFEINIIVATAGVAILSEDLILKIFGAYPFRQPLQLDGTFRVGGLAVTYQSIAILAVAAALVGMMAWILTKTRFGLAIRATAMNREAAMLMGVKADQIYLQVLVIAGLLAAAAGIMISSLASLSPQMGANPLLRAFVICVVASLGSVTGAGFAAVALGLFEAAIQYYYGVRYGFPIMLALVITVLIWKPAGLFGQQEVIRS